MNQPEKDRSHLSVLDDDAEELYDNAPCAYVSLLSDGTIVKANQTFFSWTGFDRTHVVGRRRISDVLAPGDRIFYETHLDPLLRMQGRVREIALELIVRDGTRLPVIANAILRRDVSGAPAITRLAMFDARERRAYENELVEARRRAEASEARATALARTLQASLFPPTIPRLPGLDVGAAYHPTGDGATVGGDFYDVFERPDGSVVIVMGDVVGKGPQAAVLTSLVRHTVRSEALRRGNPAAILRTVGNALVTYYPDDYCTAVLVLVDPPPRRSATVATGGHHLPLRLSADGTIGTVGAGGRLLGILPDADISERTIAIDPGDTIVMFTDGVVEARRGAEFYGEERLVATTVATTERSAQAIAEAIGASALAFQNGVARDDIVVVVWKRTTTFGRDD